MVFMKPESALKRADELIEVGKKQRALETLLEVVKSRRHRTWTKTHEPLMEKLLDLCVDLKKSSIAKDGLHQYKTIAQTVSVKSLEDVIMRYLKQGEERCLNARKEATNALVDIDDLEVLQSPESLLLSAVSGESQQDRTDRDMLAPWLKFVWESYKQCLDLLKNNNRVEKIYQEVAQMGFRFCQQYNRRPEFRKLCDTIRTHFSQSQKYSQQTYSVNLQLPETQALHLETRLVQLDTAIAMELWQEAFKAVEDIHHFTTISKKTPRPQQLATYYNKVALVFWKAGNYVFHATTVLKLYVLHREQKKNMTNEEKTRLSTKALLAILSIPLPAPRTQIDEHLETEETLNDKQKRLTSLLSLQQVPTRASLLRDMNKQGVLNFVHPELKDMYEWLEVEFHPLRLSAKMEEGIQFVEALAQPEYSQYMPALRDVTVVRLLQQVSQVYQTIELKRFISLAPSIDQHRLEKIIVNAARNNDVQVHIEHKSQALTFGRDLNVSTARATGSDAVSKANIIQKMPNEQIRNQLISISRALYSCMEVTNDKANKERNDKLRREIAQTYYRDEPVQRREILKRREFIERYKEDKEKEYRDRLRQNEMVSKTKQAERDEQEKSQREADQKRRRDEAAVEKEKEEHRFAMKIAIDKLRESEIGRKIIAVIGEEDLYTYDPNSINSLHIDAVIKHSREQKEKLKVQYKKVDYLIRALHESEVPLLQKQSEDDTTFRRDTQLAARENAIHRRERLVRMDSEKSQFLLSIRGQRHEDYVEKAKEFEQRLQVARQKSLAERRVQNIEKRTQDFRKERILKKQRKEDEKQRKIDAELKRQRDERLASSRAADDEKNKKLAEQARKQREREEEIEARLRSEKETAHPPSSSGGGGGSSVRRTGPPTTGGHQQAKDKTDTGAWRRNPREDDENQPSQSDQNAWRPRNNEQRPRGVDDRRVDDSTGNKGSANEPWRTKPRPDPQYRDERRDDRRPDDSAANKGSANEPWRTKPRPDPQHRDERREDRRDDRHDDRRDDRRGFSSQQTPQSPSSTSDNWRTVEKKRPNPPRPSNERPSQQQQQRPDEQPSSGAWKPKSRPTMEQRDEPRDGGRGGGAAGSSGGPQSSQNWGRSEENNSWRARERTRLDSWRGNDNEDDDNDRPRPSGGAPEDDRRNDTRRGPTRDAAGGNRD